MATTPEYIAYDGNPSNPNGLTPFGIFDAETTFQSDGPKVANYVASRLGYPILDVELQDQQVYACFEEAVIEYGKQVNQFRARDYMYNMLGNSTNDDMTQRNIIGTPLNQVIKLSKDYGSEALSGGNVELKRGSFTTAADTASYDLKSLWGDVSESGRSLEIRKVFHNAAPAFARYYDPFSTTGLGITNLFAEFGFDGYSPAITFVMMPAYEDMLRVQAIEINDMIRKSIYTFTISDNKLRISPIPTTAYEIYFDYYVENEKTGSVLQSGSANDYVSDLSNVQLDHIPYNNINSIGKVWIYKYTLALSKELLGLIRSKYERVPIPNQDIRMDGELLRREAVQEKADLIEELQETLMKAGYHEQMKLQAESVDNQVKIIGRVPLPIYVK
jgi:hypothetical protein|tara:strand:+ start:3017 stop:4180 length:1164 start_codon:yes stop_codon:yes gene_type:complete